MSRRAGRQSRLAKVGLDALVRSHRILRSSAIRSQAKAVARAVTPLDDSSTPAPRMQPFQEMRAMLPGRDTPHTARDSSPPRYSPGGSR